MTKNKYNGPRLHLGLIEEIKAAFIDFLPAGIVLFKCFTNYDIFNMDFGQDLEPEELTNHYDQCYNPK